MPRPPTPDCQFAIDAGDTVFAPRMKVLLLRAVLLVRRRHALASSTRGQYRRRLDRDFDASTALGPTHLHGQRLRKRYGKVRGDLFTFLIHPDATPDNNSCERELRPTAIYRKIIGGFRSQWDADLFASVRSVVGMAARSGVDATRLSSTRYPGAKAQRRVEQLRILKQDGGRGLYQLAPRHSPTPDKENSARPRREVTIRRDR